MVELLYWRWKIFLVPTCGFGFLFSGPWKIKETTLGIPMTTIFQDKRIPVNRVELQVRQYEGAGAAIVFLHFSGANMMMWSRAVHHFQESHRLVLVDLRGHGRSDRPSHGYGADDMAEDVLGVMTALGIEKAHVIGSSMGAEVGLSLAANHPERVISLACDGALASEYGPYGTWNGSEKAFEDHVTAELKKMTERPERIHSSIEELVNTYRENLEPVGWWNADVEVDGALWGKGPRGRQGHLQSRQGSPAGIHGILLSHAP